MDGLLTAIKTVKQEPDHSLATVETTRRSDALTPSSIIGLDEDLTPNQIIDVLKSQPSSEQISTALAALDPFNRSKSLNVDIRVPGPVSAQILQTLVSTTIPDHWASVVGNDKKLKSTKIRAALLRCLSSVAGIGSLVARLRSLILSARASSQQIQGSNSHSAIQDILSVLAALLEPKDFLFRLYGDNSSLYDNHTRQKVSWNELVSLVASGKIVSTAAEAFTVANKIQSSSIAWVGDGRRYASWLGVNISHFISKLDVNDESGWSFVATLTERALSLGYSSSLVPEIYASLLRDQSFSKRFSLFVDKLRLSAQLTILQLILLDLPIKYSSIRLCDYPNDSSACTDIINGAATLLSTIIGDRLHFKEEITDWLAKGRFAAAFPVGINRAIVATYDNENDALKTLIIRALEHFGDKFAINHNSDREHDANAQIILLAAGRLSRLGPSQIKEVGRSGAFLTAISNRLAASSNRARLMGMIVGTGMSELVEEPGKSMKFDLEEMRSAETQWYLSLIRSRDDVGSFESIQSLLKTDEPSSAPSKAKNPKPPSRPQRIVEVISDDEDEDDETEDEDLIPYEKPDDDAEDDDEDATLVQRNKPTAPVYIRDLVTWLRDNENVERYHLAITTAPSLIRRKIEFGSELAEYVEELALTIVGLQNDSNHPQFHEARLQSMIALIVSQPLKMARWFAAFFFEGDLSQVQRSAVLTALGLSAREISGNGEDDAKALGLPALQDTSFPSKRLAPALDAMFQGSKDSPISALTREMSKASLQPMAANAADAVTGPNALKVRTFSTRMEVEKKRQQRAAQRQKSVAKDLHKVLAEGFFYPLTSRFTVMMLQFSSSSVSSHNPFMIPHIFTLFLQTLSLILTTSGPHSTFLPGLTHDTLSLLLSLHTSPISNDPTVTAALLTLFLAAIDLNIASGSNGEERLVTECANQVIELREWASQVFDNTPAAPGKSNSNTPADTQDQVRTLAAGVMIRIGEITERYQGRLMGVNAGFKY
ncbi:uncharacterized protein N7484_004476 [Penicillium longicatenatum]|uniref:uncharacterized protein n=1 Tax=Penicillium longicatenatum TaxID=1561947 RepID=UPI0025485A24|nr:uncharacterized protein N7484_004476 [Penicillium longicatenatum]KAJ5650753.1 hypothetical protein N7484_004476 [Penicillium longicatenatum]